MTEMSHKEEERIVPMRLQKFLARSGVASRRGSEDLMTAGRVRVNGEVVRELGSKVDPLVDIVTVDGKMVRLSDEPVTLMLHKPAGYLTTMSDPLTGRRLPTSFRATAILVCFRSEGLTSTQRGFFCSRPTASSATVFCIRASTSIRRMKPMWTASSAKPRLRLCAKESFSMTG